MRKRKLEDEIIIEESLDDIFARIERDIENDVNSIFGERKENQENQNLVRFGFNY